ncbi:MAG: glycoside hydrolase family 2 TIM barrel-domain containing protein [Bacteroidota bacterium]
MRLVVLLFISLWYFESIGAQSSSLLQNAFQRPSISLNGDWQYAVDRYESYRYTFQREPYDSLPASRAGRDVIWKDAQAVDRTDRLEYNWETTGRLHVPGGWNNQQSELFYYEGLIWYRKRFELPSVRVGERVFLYFGAANYRADVYLNGEKVGYHEGGFTPFNFDITDQLRAGDNSLVVGVDNSRDPAAVPTDVTDWWNYGGLTRDVKLLVVPATHLQDYLIQLDPDNPEKLRGYVQLQGPDRAGQKVQLLAAELGLDLALETDDNGRVDFSQSLDGAVKYWMPENPHRYQFELILAEETVYDRIGLRTIRTEGDQILLNGEPIFLRGICVHEENPLKGGRATGQDDVNLLLDWAEELNANFLRLAHYPHNEYMAREAERRGILLWEEVPVYWTIDWENPATYAAAERQLTELIARDKNRASVIIWSMANETPELEARLDFLRRLAAHARELDDTRLISAALFKENLADGQRTVSDPFGAYSDIIAFNQYLGWYEGTPEIARTADWIFQEDKPVIVSEFGGGALAGLRGDSLTRWSEDYQDYLFREQLAMLDRMPQLAGMTPWLLADFRSPRRILPRIQDGWNRKGLVGQHGERKLAFYRLQTYYQRRQE